MICLRCGHCCISYPVIIVDKPELGPREDNLINKPVSTRCQHLVGSEPGEYSCAVHEEEWFSETPCAQYTQVENVSKPCRIGAFILSRGIPQHGD